MAFNQDYALESRDGDQRPYLHGWMSAGGSNEAGFTDASLTVNAFSSTCL